jgi:hypothetical protein
MKITDWCKNLRFALVAAGIWAPSAVYAQNIPLLDPSFENYVVPAIGYAYSNEYRPTSAWVDDLDSPPDYTEDDGESNWLYNAAYAEDPTNSRRAAPRTGDQAMHGIFHYNAQETTAVFEANKAYTFSMWSQGDQIVDSADSSRVFLYLFDGSVPFSEDNSLTFQRYGSDTGDFIDRPADTTPAQSQAMWTQINISHGVLAGSPEIGHPIGVGFWVGRDGCVDDASLFAEPIENVFMFAEVNTTTGQVAIKNQTGDPFHIDYYEITAPGTAGDYNDDGVVNAGDYTRWRDNLGATVTLPNDSTPGMVTSDDYNVWKTAFGNGNSLDATDWNSLQEQDFEGGGAPGTGNGWEQSGGSDANLLSEAFLTGNSLVSNGASIPLGAAFNPGSPQNLEFRYSVVPSDGMGGFAGPGTLIRGFVKYVTSGVGAGSAVPEPSSVLLVGIGLATLAVGGGRSNRNRAV